MAQAQKPDILVFMSDQHTPYYSGFRCGNVDTPHMDRLAAEGADFCEAYTTCPLCVPARASMLTALRPANTGIFTLADAIPDTTPTFLHNLVEAGYETVLAGRMHFLGQDQRHGFTKRLAADMTPVTWARPNQKIAEERGVWARCFGGPFATEVVGGGEGPVEHYDGEVVAAALEYLAQPHEKPQFVCVSLYAPHFPYVAPVELFQKYAARAKLPASFGDGLPPLLAHHAAPGVSEATALGAQAAYCGMIERLDGQLGQVRAAFDAFCKKRGSRGLFCYVSDHGDQCGDRKIFGKQTFYERSAKIPLLFAGDGVAAGHKVTAPVSIQDLGPTLLEYAGAKPMRWVDGVSLAAALEGGEAPPHTVYSEFLERTDAGPRTPGFTDRRYSYGLMVREGPYKLITYSGHEAYDQVYDVAADPDERQDLAARQPALLARLRALADTVAMPQQAVRLQMQHDRAAVLFALYDQAVGRTDGPERWSKNPPSARSAPAICVNGPGKRG